MAELADELPDGAIVLSELRVIEFLDPEDGDIYVTDLSRGADGEDLPVGKALQLAEWARGYASLPMLAEMVHDFVYGEDESGDDSGSA